MLKEFTTSIVNMLLSPEPHGTLQLSSHKKNACCRLENLFEVHSSAVYQSIVFLRLRCLRRAHVALVSVLCPAA